MAAVCYAIGAPTVRCACDASGACDIIGPLLGVFRALFPTANFTCVAAMVESCLVGIGFDEVRSPWTSTGAYDADPAAVMYRPPTPIHPLAFTYPFTARLWIVLIVLTCAITPLASSLIEFRKHETLLGNFKTYFPDSVHAYAVVDILKRNGSVFSQQSALLSVFITFVAKILVSLYSCNLAAYVISSYYADYASRPTRFDVAAVADVVDVGNLTIREIVRTTVTNALDAFATGRADAVVASLTTLQIARTCDDVVSILEDAPPKIRTVAVMPVVADVVGRAVRCATADVPPTSFAIECPVGASSIGLGGTFVAFAAFGASMAMVCVAAAVAYVRRHAGSRDDRIEFTPSTSSLPESVHA